MSTSNTPQNKHANYAAKKQVQKSEIHAGEMKSHTATSVSLILVTASIGCAFKTKGGENKDSTSASASQAGATAGQIHPPHHVITVSGRIMCHTVCQIPVQYGSVSTSLRPPSHQIHVQSHIHGMCWKPGSPGSIRRATRNIR